MKKVSIIYWSGTGNTELMANAIAQGVKEGGAEAAVCAVSAASGDIINAETLILGCPSMGAENLEESEMEPFMASLEGKLSGKKVGLFGSYDWGEGQWMRDWEQRVSSAGASLIADGLIINKTPDAEGLAKCKEYGKKAASL